MIEIRPAAFPADRDLVQAQLREYQAGLGIDLCFQDFEAELEGLPGKYAPPAGRLLLALDAQGEAAGCVALRPVSADTAEMKRLYVRPAARGQGLGLRLAQRICAEARAAGYRRVCLDTLPSMGEAVHLYERMGFAPTEPYVFNPLPGAMFLALAL